MTLESSIESKRYQTLELCAILCGQIQIKFKVGWLVLVEQDTFLVKIVSTNSIGLIIFLWYVGHINLLCKDIKRYFRRNLLQYGQLRIIAIDVEM